MEQAIPILGGTAANINGSILLDSSQTIHLVIEGEGGGFTMSTGASCSSLGAGGGGGSFMYMDSNVYLLKLGPDILGHVSCDLVLPPLSKALRLLTPGSQETSTLSDLGTTLKSNGHTLKVLLKL